MKKDRKRNKIRIDAESSRRNDVCKRKLATNHIEQHTWIFSYTPNNTNKWILHS